MATGGRDSDTSIGSLASADGAGISASDGGSISDASEGTASLRCRQQLDGVMLCVAAFEDEVKDRFRGLRAELGTLLQEDERRRTDHSVAVRRLQRELDLARQDRDGLIARTQRLEDDSSRLEAELRTASRKHQEQLSHVARQYRSMCVARRAAWHWRRRTFGRREENNTQAVRRLEASHAALRAELVLMQEAARSALLNSAQSLNTHAINIFQDAANRRMDEPRRGGDSNDDAKRRRILEDREQQHRQRQRQQQAAQQQQQLMEQERRRLYQVEQERLRHQKHEQLRLQEHERLRQEKENRKSREERLLEQEQEQLSKHEQEQLRLHEQEQLRLHEQERLRQEEQERLRQEQERLRQEEQERLRQEEQERLRQEEQERLQQEQERLRQEQERLRQEEQERLRQEEQKRLRREEQERLRQEEQERLRQEEQERLRREEQERLRQKEQERLRQSEQERLRQSEQERVRQEQKRFAREEQERVRHQEQEQLSQEQERLRREEHERLQQEEQKRVRGQEQEKLRQEQERLRQEEQERSRQQEKDLEQPRQQEQVRSSQQEQDRLQQQDQERLHQHEQKQLRKQEQERLRQQEQEREQRYNIYPPTNFHGNLQSRGSYSPRTVPIERQPCPLYAPRRRGGYRPRYSYPLTDYNPSALRDESRARLQQLTQRGRPLSSVLKQPLAPRDGQAPGMFDAAGSITVGSGIGQRYAAASSQSNDCSEVQHIHICHCRTTSEGGMASKENRPETVCTLCDPVSNSNFSHRPIDERNLSSGRGIPGGDARRGSRGKPYGLESDECRHDKRKVEVFTPKTTTVVIERHRVVP